MQAGTHDNIRVEPTLDFANPARKKIGLFPLMNKQKVESYIGL